MNYVDFCRRCDGIEKPPWKEFGTKVQTIKRFNALSRAMASGGTLGAMELALTETVMRIYRLPCDEGLDERTVQFECVKRMRDEMERFLRDDKSIKPRIRYIKHILRAGELKDNVRLTELHGAPPTSVDCLKRIVRRTLISWIRTLLEEGYIHLHEIDPPPLLDLYDYGFHGDGKDHMKRPSRRKFSWRKSIRG